MAALFLVIVSPFYAVAAEGACGQPQSAGTKPAASDALAVLKKAVGSVSSCDAKPCVCDVNGNGTVTASDALLTLKAAVGQAVALTCLGCSTTTTIPAPEGCGNGVRDGAEECEGLDGCAADQRCTAACTCEAVATHPPTSQELIARALEHGEIDYPTSLLYRVWALNQAPELPEAYDGSGSVGEDLSLLAELSLVRATLPADVETAIAPYLVRPTDPTSIYSTEPPAAAGLLADGTPTETPPPVNCPMVNGVADWGYFETEHFVVWSCNTGYCDHGLPNTTPCRDDSDCETAPNQFDGHCTAPVDGARRLVVGTVAEEVYAAFTPELGPPRPDDDPTGPEPRNRIDIYMLRPNECRLRGGVCNPISSTAIASSAFAGPCDWQRGGALTSSGYVKINATAVPTTAPEPDEPSKFRADLDHELFHVYQFGLNVEVFAVVCGPTPPGTPSKHRTWLAEATAEWASFGFFPIDDAERRSGTFSDFQNDRRYEPDAGLQVTDSWLEYEAALYLQFVQQEADSIEPVLDIWTKSQAARTEEDLDTHLDSILSFQDHFRDFGVRDLNVELTGKPVSPMFSDLDPARTKNLLPEVLLPTVKLLPDRNFQRWAEVDPLFVQHERYLVDDLTRYVRIDVSDVPNAEHLPIDAIVRVGSNWERRKVPGPIFEFCRDDAGDDISEFYLVLSNDDRRHDGKVNAQYKVETKSFCPGGWTGQIRFVQTLDEHSEPSTPTSSSIIDRHEHEEQTWTVISTAPVEQPYPGEELTATWQADHSVENVTTTVEQGCGTSTFTEFGNGSGSAKTTFDAFPAAAGSFSFTPAEQSHSFGAPITYAAQKCDGGSDSVEDTQQVVEGIGYLIAVSGLSLLTPLPDDPGHFAGKSTLVHDEQPTAGGGLQVLDLTVNWDLRRTLER
jgi:hypothetical protein